MFDVTKVTFQDSMDPSRFLRIKEDKVGKDTVVARVFFSRTERINMKKLVLAGEVTLPKRMFFVEGRTNIGFNVIGNSGPEQPAVKEPRFQRDEHSSRGER